MHTLLKLALVATGLVGCAATEEPTGDGRDDAFTTDGKLDGFSCTPAEAAAILQTVNTASLSTLKNDVGLTVKAADNIVAVRKGDDELANTADDTEFGSLAQLDAVPYIGPVAFAALLQYVHDADLVDNTVPAATQWTSETIANGSNARFAIAPNNDLVLTYSKATAGVSHDYLRLANGTEVELPSGDRFVPAVDANGTPHVFFYRPFASSGEVRHVSYRNGALVDHGSVAPHYRFWVDQSPAGTIFVASMPYTQTNYLSTLVLSAVQPDGTRTQEPLWNVAAGELVGLTVGNDNFPSVVHGRTRGIGSYARRGATGWSRRDATPLDDNSDFATTGGVNATILVEEYNVIRVYRQNGATFSSVGSVVHKSTDGIDVATDAQGTVHACYVREYTNAYHMRIETTGAITTELLGNADQCAIAADPDGNIHMLTQLGQIVNHWTMQ